MRQLKTRIGYFLHLYFLKLKSKARSMFNRADSQRKCYICGNTFNHFTKYRGGLDNFPVAAELQAVGSDIDNFGCPYCHCSDRERHLFMYFDKLDFWSKFKNAEVIHFAPETHLSKKIEACSPARYIQADLYPPNDSIQKIDLRHVPFETKTCADLQPCFRAHPRIPAGPK